MNWTLPVAVIVIVTLVAVDLMIGGTQTTEHVAQALGPCVVG